MIIHALMLRFVCVNYTIVLKLPCEFVINHWVSFGARLRLNVSSLITLPKVVYSMLKITSELKICKKPTTGQLLPETAKVGKPKTRATILQDILIYIFCSITPWCGD